MWRRAELSGGNGQSVSITPSSDMGARIGRVRPACGDMSFGSSKTPVGRMPFEKNFPQGDGCSVWEQFRLGLSETPKMGYR
jgi:hypothetical protein